MAVLIDSSVWIEYFRNGNNFEKVDFLIDENLLVINDLIIAQNVVQHNCKIYSLDKHFLKMSQLLKFAIF